jgi:hypothetical protein
VKAWRLLRGDGEGIFASTEHPGGALLEDEANFRPLCAGFGRRVSGYTSPAAHPFGGTAVIFWEVRYVTAVCSPRQVR